MFTPVEFAFVAAVFLLLLPLPFLFTIINCHSYYLLCAAFSLAFCLLLLLWSSNFLQKCLRTLPRDVKGWLRLKRLQRAMDRKWAEDVSIGEHFAATVVPSHPDKMCITEADTGRSVTFAQLNAMANKFGNFFYQEFSQEHSNSAGSIVVGILLENCIEFVALWLGISRIGGITAWINTQLRGESLAHSQRIARCTAIVTSAELLPELIHIVDAGMISGQLKIYVINAGTEAQRNCSSNFVRFIDCENELQNERQPNQLQAKRTGFKSLLAYLYTSGTTGQPKAVVIRHYRYYFMGIAGRLIYGIHGTDTLYIPLPMYHGMAGIAGVGQMIVNGCSIIIRGKFSVHNFWSDCVRHQCTVAIYIGEICRYLLGQPFRPEEAKHKIRLLAGLGLRPAIWREFATRFGIHQIGELYGATEGNATCVNIDYHVGACGFLPLYVSLMPKTSIRLVKLDAVTGDYLRHPNGLCVHCMPGETGEIIGMIRMENPTRRFEGYMDSNETEKKIIHDVEEMGDSAFASGDILHWDELGYLYFKDRRGDTFRWRGENVSSTEVEGVLQNMREIADVAVYGVEIAGEEGQAGMCAVALQQQQAEAMEEAKEEELIAMIGQRFHANLPAFAIPRYLRVCPHLERTGTFKLKKAELQREGICGIDTDSSSSSSEKSLKLFIWDRNKLAYRKMMIK